MSLHNRAAINQFARACPTLWKSWLFPPSASRATAFTCYPTPCSISTLSPSTCRKWRSSGGPTSTP